MTGNVPQVPPQPDYSIVQQAQNLAQNPVDLLKSMQEAQQKREELERQLAAQMRNRASETSQGG